MRHNKSNAQTKSVSVITINKNIMWATWAGVIVAIFFGGASLIYTIWSNNQTSQDVLVISNTDIVNDQPVHLEEWSTHYPDNNEFQTGLVPMYWRIILVNNGKSNISIMDYELTQTPSDFFPVAAYGKMDYGLHECAKNFETINIWANPIKLEPGDTVTLCSRIGLLMEPNAYAKAKEKFGENEIDTQEVLMKYLWSQGLDLYGNKVISPNQDGVYKFYNFSTVTEQTFKLIFTTSKGNKVATTISPIDWYVYSGYFIP